MPETREWAKLASDPAASGECRINALRAFTGGSLDVFLKQNFGLPISHSKLRISAVAADAASAQMLKLRKRAPLLLMREFHFGFDGQPALLAINYHNAEVMEFTTMRAGMAV